MADDVVAECMSQLGGAKGMGGVSININDAYSIVVDFMQMLHNEIYATSESELSINAKNEFATMIYCKDFSVDGTAIHATISFANPSRLSIYPPGSTISDVVALKDLGWSAQSQTYGEWFGHGRIVSRISQNGGGFIERAMEAFKAKYGSSGILDISWESS